MSTHVDQLIRASDVGLYVFCARAWRLKADGYESQNVAEMAAGGEAHRAHGGAVAAYHRRLRWSQALFVMAVVLSLLWLLLR